MNALAYLDDYTHNNMSGHIGREHDRHNMDINEGGMSNEEDGKKINILRLPNITVTSHAVKMYDVVDVDLIEEEIREEMEYMYHDMYKTLVIEKTSELEDKYRYADKVRELTMKGKVLLIPKIHFNILIFSAIALPISLLSLVNYFINGYSLIPPFISGLLALYAIGWGGTVLLLKNSWGWKGKDE